VKNIEEYAMEQKWHGRTRYKCPKCAFDSISIPNFREHLAGHGARLIPCPEIMALKINQTEVN